MNESTHAQEQADTVNRVRLVEKEVVGVKMSRLDMGIFPHSRDYTREIISTHLSSTKCFFPMPWIGERASIHGPLEKEARVSERTRIQGADGAPNERCGRVRGRRTQTAQKASHLEQCAGETHLVPSLLKILPADAVGDLACKGRIHREISMHAACFRRKLWRAVKSSRACVPHSVIFSVRDQDKREWSIRPTVSWWLKESNPVGPA